MDAPARVEDVQPPRVGGGPPIPVFYYFARCLKCPRQHQQLALRQTEPAPTHCYECGEPYASVELLDHEETAATHLARARAHQKRLEDMESNTVGLMHRLEAAEHLNAALEARLAGVEQRAGISPPPGRP